MTETIENLAQNLRADEALIKTHLNNPFAHPIADPFNMSKEGYAINYGFVSRKQIGQALGMPWYVPDNTDIFSLDPGYYKCYKPKGLPDNISTKAYAWMIKVNYPTDSSDVGIITVTNELGSELVAVRHSGNWSWLRYGDRINFQTDELKNQKKTWYSLIHAENKILVHIHIDLDITIGSLSLKTIGTSYPGLLWSKGWDGVTENGANQPCTVKFEDGTYGVGQLYFTPSLIIANPNSKNVTKVWSDIFYEIEKCV